MAKTYLCERVDLDFVDAAPFRFVSTVDLAITPEQLFEVLADAESWPHWATRDHQGRRGPAPNRAASAPPGRSRCAAASSAMRSSWRGNRHATWPSGSTRARRHAIAAFAEDYRVVPTADGCHLTWVMAMKPNGLAAQLGMSIGRPVMAWMFQRFLHNLRRYTDTALHATYPVSTGRSHAARRTASGSSTDIVAVDRMTRVRRRSVS